MKFALIILGLVRMDNPIPFRWDGIEPPPDPIPIPCHRVGYAISFRSLLLRGQHSASMETIGRSDGRKEA